MKTTIDKAGRLVIPQAMRARTGLLGGGEVEVEVQGAAIIIEPVTGDDLSRESSLVVIPRSGVSITDEDVREQRLVDQR